METENNKTEKELLSEINKVYIELIDDDGHLYKKKAIELRELVEELVSKYQPKYYSSQEIWGLNSIMGKEVQWVYNARSDHSKKQTRKSESTLRSAINDANNNVYRNIKSILNHNEQHKDNDVDASE